MINTVNHEKCNANTIRIISHIVESQSMKLKSLNEAKFVDKLTVLFTSTTDMIQGEEIIELINIYLEKVLKEVNVDISAIDNMKKHKKDLSAFLTNQTDNLAKIHQHCIKILCDSQGVVWCHS